MLVNLPLYFVSVVVVPWYTESYPLLSAVALLLSIGAIVYTTVVSVDAMKRFE